MGLAGFFLKPGAPAVVCFWGAGNFGLSVSRSPKGGTLAAGKTGRAGLDSGYRSEAVTIFFVDVTAKIDFSRYYHFGTKNTPLSQAQSLEDFP